MKRIFVGVWSAALVFVIAMNYRNPGTESPWLPVGGALMVVGIVVAGIWRIRERRSN